MKNELSRRTVLAGIATGAAGPALSSAPQSSDRPVPRGAAPAAPTLPSGSEDIVRKANLDGDVAYVVADATTGEILDARLANQKMPPASTLKSVTALYALDRLGANFEFETSLYAIGSVNDGKLDGDLVLSGSGDPTLDTDRLGELAIALREAGITEVTGRFLVWAGALPRGDRIDYDQPDHVSYNPAFCGLNLNFNRVHFEWKPKKNEYEMTMEARGRKYSPSTVIAQMDIVDRKSPVYSYARGTRSDLWSVARGALGKKDGARWLPVRFPALYAGDVFRTLARSNGIVLKTPEISNSPPNGMQLATTSSDALGNVLFSMMKYSTNLTAEMSGMRASLSNNVPVNNLLGSGSRMAGWAETRFGVRNVIFRDHSGLGYGSSISPLDMVTILRGGMPVAALMKRVNVPDPSGAKNKSLDDVMAVAKTGTLNFVSSLAGYITTGNGRGLVFAIFTANTEKRDAIPTEARERPPGSRSWARRSRTLQKSLLSRWAVGFDPL